MVGPLSSESVVLDTYLQSDGLQAAKNIIQVCRAFKIEDAVTLNLIQFFDGYKEECYNNAASLEEVDVNSFLKAYQRQRKEVQHNVARELQYELLSDENTIVNKFNQFLSLLRGYAELFKMHQDHVLKVDALSQKIHQKLSDPFLRHNLEKLISTTLETLPTRAEKEAWLTKILENLQKVNEKEDFLAVFFVSPFMSFSEISLRIKECVGKQILTEEGKNILQSLLTTTLEKLARDLSATKPQFLERTWLEAKEIYQKAQALMQSDSEAFQSLLQKAIEQEAKQQKDLNDLERKRNFMIRHELNLHAQFAEVLVALKAYANWQDSFSFANKERSLNAQIECLNRYSQAKKEVLDLNILDFLQKVPNNINVLSEQSSVPESFFETLPVEQEEPVKPEFKPKTRVTSSLFENLKHYGPFVVTGLVAFGTGFYSAPLMVCVLAVGTLVSLHLQEESFLFQEKKSDPLPSQEVISKPNPAVLPPSGLTSVLEPVKTVLVKANAPVVTQQALEENKAVVESEPRLKLKH